jgi:DNA polymerase III delta prime subunit
MIKLGIALYGAKDLIEVTRSKIGELGVAGLKTSTHRGGITGSPKMSAAAALFDMLFAYPNTLAVYSSDSTKTVYMEDKTSGVFAIADGRTVNYSDGLPLKYELVPDVIWELVYGSNTELRTAFSEICVDYNTSGVFRKEDVMFFCDSYYYGCAKFKNAIDDSTELTASEVIAGFRSGLFKKEERFYNPEISKYMATSIYETGETEVKKSAKAKKSGSFLTDCANGKYIIAYEWPEDMKKFIISPSFLKTFESTKEFEEIVKKIYFHAGKILERMDMGLTGAEAIGKDALNIMLLGKPGTGKTTLAYALSAALGMPVCTTAWNKHSDEDEVEGKTKIIDGKPSFVETNSLIFHQYGGIDVNEEINLADPSVTMGSLGQKLEYPYIVKKNGYETVVRHPLNVVIATMNVGTNGSNQLNQALANRFKTPYILDDPTRETFINILMKSSGKDRDVCEWVYNAYEATTEYLKDPDVNEDEICQNLSIRTCLGAIENMEEGQEPTRALINSIVGAVAVVDVEVARNLQHERIESLPNPHFVL